MAIDWKSRLRRASYRGVSFWVESETNDGGKRLGLHEYAGGLSTIVEEMGAATETFSVTAYFASDVADIEARALKAACILPGAGLLRLPMDAGRLAHVQDFSRMRERDRMGFVAFGFTAVPVGVDVLGAIGVADVSISFNAGFASASLSLSVVF
jgi:prophage DNA circulation protein